MKIKITTCKGFGPAFGNLKPDTIHDVIKCPDLYNGRYKDDIWVWGVGEPVRLIPNEYNIVEE